MVHHLQIDFVLCASLGSILGIFVRFLTHRAVLFALARVLVTKPREFDSIRDRVPLEIEHRVNRLNLDPPVALLERIPNQIAIVSVPNNELVTILNVCILERNLAHYSLENVSVSTGSFLLLLHELTLLMCLQLQHIELLLVSFGV